MLPFRSLFTSTGMYALKFTLMHLSIHSSYGLCSSLFVFLRIAFLTLFLIFHQYFCPFEDPLSLTSRPYFSLHSRFLLFSFPFPRETKRMIRRKLFGFLKSGSFVFGHWSIVVVETFPRDSSRVLVSGDILRSGVSAVSPSKESDSSRLLGLIGVEKPLNPNLRPLLCLLFLFLDLFIESFVVVFGLITIDSPDVKMV